MCTDKDKLTLSAYDIQSEKKTSSTSEKKKNHGMVMLVSMNNVKNYALQPLNVCEQHSK